MPSNLPAGATIDPTPAGLPQGATVDNAPTQLPAGATIDPSPAGQTQPHSFIDDPNNPYSADTLMGNLRASGEQMKGIVKGAAQTAAGISRYSPAAIAAHFIPGVREQQQAQENWISHHIQTNNPYQKDGATAEAVGEFLALPEIEAETLLTKVPSVAEYFGKGAELTKFLGNNPKALTLLRLGLNSLKGGAAQGTQEMLKTGDPKKAWQAAKWGTLAEAGLRGAGEAVGGTARAITSGAADAAPEAAEIAGKTIPRVAEGAPGKIQAAQADAQQEGLQGAFGTVMNRAVKKGLEPYEIDAKPALHFGDVEDQLKKAAATDFDELSARAANLHGEDVGQKVQQLNQAVNDASITERGAAKKKLFDYLDTIDDPRYPDSLRDTAIRARNTYQKGFMAEDLHKLMGKYFNEASPETAELLDKPYSLDLAGKGANMKDDLRKFENDYGHDDVVNFLGKDGFKNLHNMADVASDPVYNENANNILKQVISGAHEGQKGKWVPSSVLSTFTSLPFMKVLAGLKAAGAAKGGAEAALPMLKYQIATNPRIGRILTYGAKAGLTPQYVAPFIHAAIYGELNEQEKERQTQLQPAKEK